MIKVPGHRGRDPGDRGAHRARRQRQRHAAVLGRALRAGDRRLPRAASSAASPPGEPVDAIASVASFFVSRIDTKADAAAARRLARCAAGSRSPTPASPTRATASASPTSAGARCATPAPSPQRPLWASTGTKDPAYSDVLYVEELIAPDVINTMPEATLRAFADHGDVAPHARRRRARRRSETLRRAAERGHRPRRDHRRARARGRALVLRLLPRAARLHRDEAPPRRARGARNRAARRHVTVAPAEAGRRDPAG